MSVFWTVRIHFNYGTGQLCSMGLLDVWVIPLCGVRVLCNSHTHTHIHTHTHSHTHTQTPTHTHMCTHTHTDVHHTHTHMCTHTHTQTNYSLSLSLSLSHSYRSFLVNLQDTSKSLKAGNLFTSILGRSNMYTCDCAQFRDITNLNN